MRFDQSVVQRVVKTWEKEETQELIQALVADIKKQARHTSNQRNREFLVTFAEQVQDLNFWDNVDTLLHINLDY